MRQFVIISIKTLIFAVAFLLASTTAKAYELSLDYGRRTADMAYEINDSGDRSRLTFPVDNQFIRTKLSDDFPFEIPFVNLISWELSHTDFFEGASGKGRDYDRLSDSTDLFLVGETHEGVDIYSEAEAKLREGRIYHGSVKTSLNDFFPEILHVTGGYWYSEYQIRTFDLQQKGFGPYASFTGKREGLIISYDRRTYSPYAGLDLSFQPFTDIKFSTELRHSFEVRVEDRDDHHLRNKLSKGDLYGDGDQIQADLRYQYSPSLSVSLRAEYMEYEASGHQDQRWYGDDPSTGIDDTGTEINDIPMSVTSEEESYSAGLAYTW